MKVFLHNPTDKSTISSNNIRSFYEDKKGNIWVRTTKGLNRYIPGSDKFTRIIQDLQPHENPTIFSIFEDKTGRIWTLDLPLQNEGSHLSYLDSIAQKLVLAQKNEKEYGNFPLELVYYPFKDHHDNIWFGTYGGGVLMYAPHQKKFDLIRSIPENKNTLSGNSSWAISEDSLGKLWLALFQDGLDCYDPATGEVIHFKEKIASLIGTSNFTVISVICDKNNRVWIGTMGQGVISMDINTGKMVHYLNKPEYKNYISSNFVLSFNLDKSGNLIITYPDRGFDIMDLSTFKVKNYSYKANKTNSLRNNSVRYVRQTSDGNYWISTDGAISVLNPLNSSMTH
ncbi:MAG: hypothetical protein HC905_19480 [Bacteroidales bacterium]|nr:hypothetical protein [Bacteroidales bacterium]